MTRRKTAARPAKRSEYTIPILPTPKAAPPRSFLGRWLLHGNQLGELQEAHESAHPWHRVLWLTGVDYFSTLGYQPGIALLAAAALSPVATAILVAVTLLGALPTYAQVARRSYAGQGSIAMLENLLPGWGGKLFVLILLGFAATDFVITMTLSAADAAQHAIENPYLHPYLGEARLGVTIGLMVLLAIVFLKGFREAIGMAMGVAVPYLLLNLVVIVRGFMEIGSHPELISNWRLDLLAHGDWTMLLLASALIFPRLALGLSGFETGVTVMPLISADSGDGAQPYPSGRIRATRKLLASAALIMGLMLLTSSFVTTLLIPPEAYAPEGPAAGRAIAYLAHRLLGSTFGSIYDLSTIAILWFAGASAMAGLLHLIPRYLPRFGMAPDWVRYTRPLVLVLLAIDVIVTLIFEADVEAQSGAYATGVLALILSAAIAVALSLWKESRQPGGNGRSWQSAGLSLYFWLVSAVFGFTFIDNIVERPDGVIIATTFTLAILLFSAASRFRRSTELRVSEITFVDLPSSELWPSLVGKKVNAVPIRISSPAERARKAREIRQYYQVTGPLVFIHVNLVDNRSEFLARLRIRVRREGEDFVVETFGAVAIANTIAYLSELLDPISLFLGLTRQSLMTQSLRYLLWGEGEVGLMVYTILLRYWEWTPEEDIRPLIFLMSE
ncbi:MAG: hypothetical protein HYY20_08225 [Candidatus Tectomicrobia bacterium]|uniref:Amino acid transporter n=1 Tax=Tectimicrobiota bacterium TaxID=2528274 RepID=A0A932FWZ8_UNCTE|nr:hypothetical protein [Candidatus Tectomicrobia bacterium]